jgi:hypothetical protein
MYPSSISVISKKMAIPKAAIAAQGLSTRKNAINTGAVNKRQQVRRFGRVNMD